MSAWRTQRRTDSTEMSKSAATSAWLRSPRRATRTTSRLNSGGNFLGTTTSSPRDKIPQNECQLKSQQSQWLSVGLAGAGVPQLHRVIVVGGTQQPPVR